MTFQLITNRQDLDDVSKEWNDVLRASASDCIFLTWEWISAWLDAVQPDARLLVVIVRDRDERLIAIGPFYRTRMRLLGLIPYRCLRVIGDRDAGAEYPDVIIRRGFEEQAMSTVLTALLEHRNMWDCIWLPNVAGWTGAFERFQRACARSALPLHERPRDFSAVELPETHDAYFASLSGKARTNIRRAEKRLSSSSQWTLIRCENEDSLAEMLSRLYDLHHRRWSTVSQDGSFVRRPRMVRFYDRFAPAALNNGWLRLYGLKVDGTIRAVQYGYVYNGVFHSLQEGFDPEAPKGTGNVLRNLVISACIEEGRWEYDFLGGYTAHKRGWGATPRIGHDLFLGRRSLKNRLLFTKPVWPTGRYIKESV